MALITFRLITAYYYVVKVQDNRFFVNIHHLLKGKSFTLRGCALLFMPQSQ